MRIRGGVVALAIGAWALVGISFGAGVLVGCSAGDDSPSSVRITEDDAAWDCRTMGNNVCGPVTSDTSVGGK